MPNQYITVRELADRVSNSELMLPAMQRGYVWPGTRVRDLLDSLYRGYPSGNILVWETNEAIEARGLAVEASQEAATSRRLLLLDGQQRITSLSAVLEGKPVNVRGKVRPIHILFNLEHPEGAPREATEVDEDDLTVDIEDIEDEESAGRDIQAELKQRTFVVATGSLKNDPLWVAVSDIFKMNDRDLLKPLGINSDDPRWDKYAARLQKVRDISKYTYLMQVLGKELSYVEVTDIFVRVNSKGIKLRGSDLAMAQITSLWKGFMAEVEEFAAEFKGSSDYIIESGLPVRLLAVFATKQSRFETVNRLSLAQMKESWGLAKEGLRFAINFVRENAAVESLHHLSSPFLLVTLAVYWMLKKGEALSPDDQKKLLRWFYYAHMRGHYGMGSSESILDADLSVLFKTNSLDELLKQLLLHVKKLNVDADDLTGRGIRSPFFSMLYLILRKDGAEDWWSGLKLSESHSGKAHKIQFHHIFPKSLLKEDRYGYDKKEINEIANMAFIGGKTNRTITNKEPTDYLETEVVAKRTEKALQLQLIPLDRGLWELTKYREFLAARRQAIVDAINGFMAQYE